MMDAKIKKLWLKALRSGRYRQGRGQLVNSRNEYCCLGVLCKVVGAVKNSHFDFEYGDDRGFGFLPNRLRRELHITKRQEDTLSGKNDRGKSFKEIADYIEKKL